MRIGRIEFTGSPSRGALQAVVLGVATFVLLLPLRLLFVPNDHEGYVDLIDEVASSGDVAFGKGYVALFYSVLGAVLPVEVYTNAIFLLYLVVVSRHAKNLGTLVLHLVLIAPLSPYFGYVTKEAMLVSIALLAYAVSRFGHRVGVSAFVVLVAVFGVFVRQYYLPLLVLASILPLLSRYTQLLLIVFIMCVLHFLGEPIYDYVLQAKRAMWERLFYHSTVNTLFPLDFPDSAGPTELIFVWAQNVFYICTASLRMRTLTGFASLVSLVVVVVAFVKTFKSGSMIVWLFSFFSLMFASFLVPDSGTFVRHSTMMSVFALFSVLLARRGEQADSYADV
jgi:hypothetical protein